jgi:hypothetical protein
MPPLPLTLPVLPEPLTLPVVELFVPVVDDGACPQAAIENARIRADAKIKFFVFMFIL